MQLNKVIALSVILALISCDRPHADAASGAGNAVTAASGGPTSELARAGLPTLAPVLAKVSPAVVSISVQGTIKVEQSALFRDPLFRRFFGLPENVQPNETPTQRFRAVGSGVIIDADRGYLITSNHVVDKADKILVTLKDRRQLTAKLIATDPKTDIAVLGVAADHLTSLPFGSSRQVQVGDYVVAIGNPFGVGQTATFGIVSALGRTGLGIESYEDFIQTDASINPGNSGGALVDTAGRLIGINTAILSGSGGNVGVGFAVPIDLVRSVSDQLIAHGKISRGALGIVIQDLTPDLAQAMGASVSHGAVVSQVLPKSAAARADIKEGDIITSFEGEPVASSSQLRNSVSQKPPGSNVRIILQRDGKELSVTATLDPLAAERSTASPNSQGETPLFGMALGPIPEDDSHKGKLQGVYVISVEPGSAADEAGLRQGDIIVAAGRIAVTTPSELEQIIQKHSKGMPLLLRIIRGDSALFIALE